MRGARVTVPLIATSVALVAAGPAVAGPPGGSRYVGRTTLRTRCDHRVCRKKFGIAFDVSPNGRGLLRDSLTAPTGSRISTDGTADEPCTGVIDLEFGDDNAMQIKPDGRFRAAAHVRRRGGRATLVVAGAFSGNRVSGSLSITRRGGSQPPCANSGTFAAHRDGAPYRVAGSCTPPHSHTLLDDGRLRVYEDARPFTEPEGARGHLILGCDRQVRRRYILDTRVGGEFPEHVGSFVSAGDLVAWGSQECEPFDGATKCFYAYVNLVDLGRGADLGGVRLGSRSRPPQIVLKPNGSFAWLACGDSCVVGRKDSRGYARLDLAPTLSGLTLSGSTLTWRHDATIMSADLL